MSNGLRRARKNKATKRPDLSNIKEALRDDRAWCALGTIIDPNDGSGTYFDLTEKDLLVEVELHPGGEQLTALVGTVAGSFGAGVWAVPPLGAEVYVLIPDGDLDLQPCVIGLSSSRQLPEDVGPTTLVIAAPTGGEVIVHDGTGTAKKLAFQEDLVTLRDSYNGHNHQYAQGLTSPPAHATPAELIPNPDYPVPDPVNVYLPIVPDADTTGSDGTEVLKGK